jgi:hypothetical protein
MEPEDINKTLPFDKNRLAMLGVSSLLLCVSFLMSVLTPFPIALAAVLYGRKVGYGTGVVAWIVSLLLSSFIFKDGTIFLIYSLSMLATIAIGEIAIRQIKPLRGMMIAGGSFLLLLSLIFTYAVKVNGLDVQKVLLTQLENSKEIIDSQKKLLEKSSGESKEAFEALALLNQPELIVDQVIKEAPSWFFVTTFLVLWLNLFLVLKSNRITRKWGKDQYSEFELLNIKVPDQMIWPVILSLLLALFGDRLGVWYPIVGLNLLKCLGVFYFFQGFGIYLAFLDYVRIGGFIRTILIMLTVFTAFQVMALIGLFDMFVNFRRFFIKDKNQGEL